MKIIPLAISVSSYSVPVLYFHYMKKFIIMLALIPAFYSLHAQYSLRLIVTGVATRQLDDIYAAGSFNNWNPHNDTFKLKPFGRNRKAIVLKDVPAGSYQFKFTRGAWNNVETNPKGIDIANRQVQLNSDTTLNITVEGWKDDFPDKPKPNTATLQVQIIDTAFFIPQLNRYRRIWVYLPKSYNQLKSKSYPVLYMHDGQNLFNEQTAPFGEWGIDECLDTLQQQTGKECIVVGIDNSDKRMTEYNPYDHQQYGKGEGAQYAEFLAKTLKPFIDQKYRTIKDAKHTFIAGSSMGGLISLYTQIKYPTVFGTSGIFSPAFWLAPQLIDDINKTNLDNSFLRFYFYAGGKESNTMVSDMDKVINTINTKHRYETLRLVYPLGTHDEKTWRKEFDGFYKWLMN